MGKRVKDDSEMSGLSDCKGGLGGKRRQNRCGSEEQGFGWVSVSKVPAAMSPQR